MIGFGEITPVLGRLEVQVQGQPLGKVSELLARDVMIIITVALGLLLALMIFARFVYARRPKKKHQADAQRVYRGAGQPAEEDVPEAEAQESRRRYKYRWKRRRHRVRNPTLAQTGGLPPARTEEPTKPT